MRRFDGIGQYQEFVRSSEFRSPGPYVFHSGGAPPGLNRTLAESYARQHGGATMEMSESGRFLDREKLFGEKTDRFGQQTPDSEKLHPDQPDLPWGVPHASAVWDEGSRKFAQSAQGHVVAFIDPNHKGTFFRIELPELLNNSRVESINGTPRAQLLEMYNRRFEESQADGMEPSEAKNNAHIEVALHIDKRTPSLEQDSRESFNKLTAERKLLEDQRTSGKIFRRIEQSRALNDGQHHVSQPHQRDSQRLASQSQGLNSQSSSSVELPVRQSPSESKSQAQNSTHSNSNNTGPSR